MNNHLGGLNVYVHTPRRKSAVVSAYPQLNSSQPPNNTRCKPPTHQNKQVLEKDPFETLDRDGVGQLMRTAVSKGRAAKGTGVAFGICGEHGGDPQSVRGFVLFCSGKWMRRPARVSSFPNIHLPQINTPNNHIDRWSSSSSWAWTTPPAPRTASPSRASPPHRPPSAPSSRSRRSEGFE